MGSNQLANVFKNYMLLKNMLWDYSRDGKTTYRSHKFQISKRHTLKYVL